MTSHLPAGPVRVRFAPSPTGELHAGGLRTALFNYLVRRKSGGQFILRLEDTDREREVPGAGERMMADLAWAGISFDEGLLEGGPYAPYRQSERTHLYKETVELLLERDGAYRCWCSPQRLDDIRDSARRNDAPPRYDGRCRKLNPEERRKLQNQSRPSVIRLATPQGESVMVEDLIKGRVTFDSRHLDDPILERSDDRPTAILAGAVDDHLMGVTHVIRGEEWLPSTPYQMLIYRYLDWEPPIWAHLPLLLSRERSKLSKRDPGGSVAELRREGFLPEALCRYLVGLGRRNLPPDQGWDIGSLSNNFSLTDYTSGDAVFSIPALRSDNAHLLRRLPVSELVRRSRSLLSEMLPEISSWDETRLAAGLALVQGESVHLRDAVERLSKLIHPPEVPPALKGEFPATDRLLQTISQILQTEPVEWKAEAIEETMRTTGKHLGLSGRDLFAPLRLAVTGTDRGPQLPRIAELLGRREFLRRIDAAGSLWKTDGAQPVSNKSR